MNLYQIVISFLEPTQAVVTIGADTQEEAIQKLREEAEPQVSGLEIVSVIELGPVTPPAQPKEPEPAFTPLPDNVIVFPGNNSKH
jgi:hypothetical protein